MYNMHISHWYVTVATVTPVNGKWMTEHPRVCDAPIHSNIMIKTNNHATPLTHLSLAYTYTCKYMGLIERVVQCTSSHLRYRLRKFISFYVRLRKVFYHIYVSQIAIHHHHTHGIPHLLTQCASQTSNKTFVICVLCVCVCLSSSLFTD